MILRKHSKLTHFIFNFIPFLSNTSSIIQHKDYLNLKLPIQYTFYGVFCLVILLSCLYLTSEKKHTMQLFFITHCIQYETVLSLINIHFLKLMNILGGYPFRGH